MYKLVLLYLVSVLLLVTCAPSAGSVQTAIAETQIAIQAQWTSTPLPTNTPAPTNTPSYTEADYLQDAEDLLNEWSFAVQTWNDFMQASVSLDGAYTSDWVMNFINSMSKIQKAGENLGKLDPPTESVSHLNQTLRFLSNETALFVNAENGYWIDKNEAYGDLGTTYLGNCVDFYKLALEELKNLKY